MPGFDSILDAEYGLILWNIYMKCMFYCGCRWKWRVTIAANFQFKQLEGRSLKTIRASTGFEAVTSAIPVRCSTNWAVKLHIGSEVNLLTNVPVYLRSTNVLLLLPMYLRSTKCISYIFHIISLHGKTWTKQIDLAPNVWLHSSVGQASHRYRGGHEFEPRWSPDIFGLLPSNCLNWKFTAMISLHFHGLILLVSTLFWKVFPRVLRFFLPFKN